MSRVSALTIMLALTCGLAPHAQAQPVAPTAPPPAPATRGAPPAAPSAPAIAAPAAAPAAHDCVRVTLPAEHAALLEGGPTAGRMIVFLVATDARLDGEAPSNGPFFDAPQPIYSVPVATLTPGRPVDVAVDAAAYPAPLDALNGTFRVQAVFARNGHARSHLAPGNLLSAEALVDFDSTAQDTITLALSQRIPDSPLPTAPNLRFFTMKSELLTRALGKDTFHRVGVALPAGWGDPSHHRRMWPAMYVTPGFGGRAESAEAYARMLATEGTQSVVPQAVWVVLDPDSEWGHHGFVDSSANGPRAQALVAELIPELERQFRLIPRADARILTGHSSGAWTSLWLQLMYPDTFGACFASAPDPVDFSAFQRIDLYADLNYFSDAEGREQGSYRTPVTRTLDKVRMTTRDETGMEYALSPEGRSGEQLDSYAAMFSALDPATRLPRRAWDPVTGLIDRHIIEHDWSRYDITRLVRENPARFVPIFLQRVRLLVGERDNFYLERAVARLKTAIDAAVQRAAAAGTPFATGPGYIEILPDDTHDTLAASAMLRWHSEMRAYLRAHALD